MVIYPPVTCISHDTFLIIFTCPPAQKVKAEHNAVQPVWLQLKYIQQGKRFLTLDFEVKG